MYVFSSLFIRARTDDNAAGALLVRVFLDIAPQINISKHREPASSLVILPFAAILFK